MAHRSTRGAKVRGTERRHGAGSRKCGRVEMDRASIHERFMNAVDNSEAFDRLCAELWKKREGMSTDDQRWVISEIDAVARINLEKEAAMRRFREMTQEQQLDVIANVFFKMFERSCRGRDYSIEDFKSWLRDLSGREMSNEK